MSIRVSKLLPAAFLAVFAACGGAPEEGATSDDSAFTGRGQVDGNVAKFHAYDASTVYALHNDGTLWREIGTSRTLVDTAVHDFQLAPGSTAAAPIVYVLHTNGNLVFHLGTGASTGTFVDGGIAQFSVTHFGFVYEMTQNGTLYFRSGATRAYVDANVRAFQGMDASTVYVLGTDGKLWNETAPFGGPTGYAHRFEVDANVTSFKAVDDSNVYVLGSDGKLWNEHGTMNNRMFVDQNVQRYTPLDDFTIYVQGTDSNVWRYVGNNIVRDFADANARQFQPIGTGLVYMLGSDGNLWRERMPAAPLAWIMPAGGLLDSSSTVGIWPNGAYVFSGYVHNGDLVPYNYTLAWGFEGSQGRVYTFSHQGNLGACIGDCGSGSASWNETGTNAQLAQDFAALQHGRMNWTVQRTLDLNTIWNDLKTAYDTVSKVIAIAGSLL
jgi:hypothetical protein